MADFDPGEFLALAVKLSTTEPTEAAYRTCINRLYYACHLTGIYSTAAKGWFVPAHSAADHRGLVTCLKGRVSWYTQLEDLLEMREHADYHITPRLSGQSRACKYCSDGDSTKFNINQETWDRALGIAQYLHPRLRNIAPTTPTKS
jgi:hypothetical protein